MRARAYAGGALKAHTASALPTLCRRHPRAVHPVHPSTVQPPPGGSDRPLSPTPSPPPAPSPRGPPNPLGFNGEHPMAAPAAEAAPGAPHAPPTQPAYARLLLRPRPAPLATVRRRLPAACRTPRPTRRTAPRAPHLLLQRDVLLALLLVAAKRRLGLRSGDAAVVGALIARAPPPLAAARALAAVCAGACHTAGAARRAMAAPEALAQRHAPPGIVAAALAPALPRPRGCLNPPTSRRRVPAQCAERARACCAPQQRPANPAQRRAFRPTVRGRRRASRPCRRSSYMSPSAGSTCGGPQQPAPTRRVQRR